MGWGAFIGIINGGMSRLVRLFFGWGYCSGQEVVFWRVILSTKI